MLKLKFWIAGLHESFHPRHWHNHLWLLMVNLNTVHHEHFPVRLWRFSSIYALCCYSSHLGHTRRLPVEFLLLKRSLLSKTELLTVFHSRRADRLFQTFWNSTVLSTLQQYQCIWRSLTNTAYQELVRVRVSMFARHSIGCEDSDLSFWVTFVYTGWL